ncbi:DUF1127 domain-containing protein [Marinomonas transparens]|uniref:DUF1127 domain-containing protein n=1 Tax=Marinomonas transparens TaxID=2795388 RepID=A0A934MVT9_9GAMM|nr:DUF1127 domain-containing protein [Marinomonas transparens]MBJ7537414.1 DUF1127 domain-containing protein [Marinomonas transparens]
MLVISLLAHIQFCMERYQTRKALAKLTATQLKDVGINEELRTAEIAKASLGGVYQDLYRTRERE